VVERLLREQHIDQQQYQQAILQAQRVGQRLEDAVVATGAISEASLLRFMAGMYRTQFVSTRKLARANINRAVLQLVPRRVAEKLLAFPVLFDKKAQSLSVVAIDLDQQDIAKQIQMVSDVRDVRVYVALPSAIKAAIAKHYRGEPNAFAAHAVGSGSGLLSVDAQSGGGGAGGSSWGGPDALDPGAGFGAPGGDFFGGGGPSAPPQRSSQGQKQPPPPPPSFTIEAPDLNASLGSEPTPEDKPQAEQVTPAAAPSWDAYLETLNVLVALLEQNRVELRGHSSQVAKGCKKVCERLGLSEQESNGVVTAAYLHDIGKASTYHLTALNVGQYEGHRVQAEKTYMTPLRMFEAVDLPDSTIQTLTHLYERIDGKGFPDRLKEKDIPRGSRILAIVETYFDLTTHAKNPYRRKLSPKEACDALEQFRDQFFDGNLIDVFKQDVLGDDLRQRLLSDRRTALVVDPDPEETTVLEMRMMEHGHEVAIARNVEDARERFGKGDIDIVITEVDLSPKDGFQLVEELRQQSDVPVIFLTRRGDRNSVTRGFDLGAADYLVKPASADVVSAKARQILHGGAGGARRKEGGRGVTGSLSEMSLPDVIQILANGRKNGRLSIQAEGKAGEVHFGEGAIYDAKFGDLSGEEAFYAMLVLTEGDFELDPSFVPSERVIHASTESLLLEGMRRLDESQI
jgi:response regulator RpfG family c-di-GMP phosphodiesterase